MQSRSQEGAFLPFREISDILCGEGIKKETKVRNQRQMTDTPLQQNIDPSPSSPLPWFKDGLHFKCTECGKCCTGSPGFVWVSKEEMVAMAASLHISVSAFKKKYVRHRDNRYALIEKKVSRNTFDCVFLKNKQCQVYQARPTQCRTYPWWNENLHSEESWKSAAEECEGINDQAPIVPYSQIIQFVRRNENNNECSTKL